MPKLRGGYPTYVEAYQESTTSGTTIHLMEEKWDNGAVVLQEEYNVEASLNNNDRYKLSTLNAANFLNELHSNNFKFSPFEQKKELITYCHKIIKCKREIKTMPSNENFEGFVKANYVKHLFPFSHLIKQFKLFSILSVRKINMLDTPKLKRISNHKILKHNNKYFIKHNNKSFEITEYVWKGKHYKIDLYK